MIGAMTIPAFGLGQTCGPSATWNSSVALHVSPQNDSGTPILQLNSTDPTSTRWLFGDTLSDMETKLNIDVATLDAPHRRALEEVIGRQLAANQRLVISVTDVAAPQTEGSKPAQTLKD